MASFQLLTGTFSLRFLIIVLSILAVSLTSVLHLVKSHDFAHGNCSERYNCASSSVLLIESYLLKVKARHFVPTTNGLFLSQFTQRISQICIRLRSWNSSL